MSGLCARVYLHCSDQVVAVLYPDKVEQLVDGSVC